MAISDILGIKFPFQAGTLGFPEPSNGFDALDASLRSLVLISKGELPMYPDLGLSVTSWIFKSVTPIFKAQIAREVRAAIERYEPRVTVLAVQVAERSEEGALDVVITYDAAGVEVSTVVPLPVPEV